MNYEITLENGDVLELPQYSMAIAKKLENADKVNAGQQPFEKKTKAVYDIVSDIIGKDKTKEIIGTFAEVDPNAVYIMYMRIVREYNRPIDEFNREKLEQSLESHQVEKITSIIDAAEKARGLK